MMSLNDMMKVNLFSLKFSRFEQYNERILKKKSRKTYTIS